jgi:thymidylate kinase
MKLIVLEGADGTGKTTAANKIVSTHTNVALKHWPAPDKNWNGSAIDYWKNAIDATLMGVTEDMLLIWDRGFLGNYIYGNRKKDQIAINEQELLSLYRWLCEKFSRIDLFIFRAAMKDMRIRQEEKAEQYVTPKESYAIQREYERAATLIKKYAMENKLRIRTHKLSQSHSPETAYNKISKYL